MIVQPLDRRDEDVSAPRHRLHDPLFAVAQRISKLENQLHQRVLGDDRRAPHRRQQLLLAKNAFRMVQEVLQKDPGLRTQWHRGATGVELVTRDIEDVSGERRSLHHASRFQG